MIVRCEYFRWRNAVLLWTLENRALISDRVTKTESSAAGFQRARRRFPGRTQVFYNRKIMQRHPNWTARLFPAAWLGLISAATTNQSNSSLGNTKRDSNEWRAVAKNKMYGSGAWAHHHTRVLLRYCYYRLGTAVLFLERTRISTFLPPAQVQSQSHSFLFSASLSLSSFLCLFGPDPFFRPSSQPLFEVFVV
jgi:hypothetical protein